MSIVISKSSLFDLRWSKGNIVNVCTSESALLTATASSSCESAAFTCGSTNLQNHSASVAMEGGNDLDIILCHHFLFSSGIFTSKRIGL